MRNTTITNTDWSATFKHDGANTFFYLDPPYEKSDNLYHHDSIDYEKFVQRLHGLKGKFLLSMNDSKEVRQLFKGFKMTKVNVLGGGQQDPSDIARIGRGSRAELFISNY